MSRRANTSSRLERRAEREARRPGGGAPRATRERRTRPTPTRVRSGFLSAVSMTTVAIVIGVGLLVAILVYAVAQASKGPDSGPTSWQKAMLNDDSKLPGTYVKPHPGADGRVCSDRNCIQSMDDREHIGAGVIIPICTQEQIDKNTISDPLCYNSNPPTSGPHSANPMPLKVLDNPAPKESLIHNMEHGAVIIWYNTDNQDVIKQLVAIANDNLDRRRLMVMSRYNDMDADTIAVTAWTRIDKFKSSDFNKKRVQDFIDEHERRFNPEGF